MTDSSALDPIAQFKTWLAEAEKTEPNDANAMSLATADSSGMPNVRMVLLKGVDAQGFVFYSNMESRKGQELAENPQAALGFHWKTLRRAVRIQGRVETVAAQESDDYFHSRARDSQIGAWASQQSRPLESRFALEKAVALFAAKHAIGTVPRPAYWQGRRIIPSRIEFWADRPFRLHDRTVFIREGEGWGTVKLYP
jgi:pyridoxamine 5'-phosphate oxidase